MIAPTANWGVCDYCTSKLARRKTLRCKAFGELAIRALIDAVLVELNRHVVQDEALNQKHPHYAPRTDCRLSESKDVSGGLFDLKARVGGYCP